jgi:hypothetical protein
LRQGRLRPLAPLPRFRLRARQEMTRDETQSMEGTGSAAANSAHSRDVCRPCSTSRSDNASPKTRS